MKFLRPAFSVAINYNVIDLYENKQGKVCIATENLNNKKNPVTQKVVDTVSEAFEFLEQIVGYDYQLDDGAALYTAMNYFKNEQ